MLDKINERYRSYYDGKNMYVLDSDSNWFSLLSGCGHTYFTKKGYIIEQNGNERSNQKDSFWNSVWLTIGIGATIPTIIRVLFGKMFFFSEYIKILFLVISLLIIIVVRVLWSKKKKKDFINSTTILKEIYVKLDYGKKNKYKRLFATIFLNSFLILFLTFFTLTFWISGSFQMYIGYLVIQAAIVFLSILSMPSKNGSPLYDFKIIPRE